jgi:hypothetical protein
LGDFLFGLGGHGCDVIALAEWIGSFLAKRVDG